MKKNNDSEDESIERMLKDFSLNSGIVDKELCRFYLEEAQWNIEVLLISKLSTIILCLLLILKISKTQSLLT